MRWKRMALIALVAVGSVLSCLGGFITSMYSDTRNFNTLYLENSAKIKSFDLWGFTDFNTAGNSDNDIDNFTARYNLTGLTSKGIGLQIEAFDATSQEGVLRLGAVYVFRQDFGFLMIRLLPFETDNTGGYCGAVWNIYFGNDISVEGFIDYHFNRNYPHSEVIIAEPQINFPTPLKNLYLVLEYRYDGFIQSSGLAIGVQARF